MNGYYVYSSHKQIIVSMIIVAILVVSVIGVSFSFFNYTRTGVNNTIQTGTIHFTSSNTQVNVVNAFPISKSEAIASSGVNTNENVTTSTVTITGYTSYTGGIDFRITAQDVTSIGRTNGNIPISVLITKSGNITNLATYNFENGSLMNNSILASGKIIGNGTSVSETITIKAFIDKDLVAISDTYDELESPSNDYGTTSNWVNNRTIITTEQWNNLENMPISFKIRVEAIQNGGSWAYSLG